MRINHNIAALNTLSQLNNASSAQSKSMEKLSSGLRINRAGDDAAGLAISEKMRGQIRGLDQASRNSQDAISLIQTAEGALTETHSILQRMRELAVQSANDTNTDSDRQEIQKEVNQLTSEINRIGNTTEFNTMKLLNGDKAIKTTAGTPVTSTTIKAGTGGDVTVAKSLGVTITGTADEQAAFQKALSGGITVGEDTAADDAVQWDDIDLNEAATIAISRDADGGLKVTLNATGKTAADVFDYTTTIDKDTLAAGKDADGNFSVNFHGVSFDVNLAEFEKTGTQSATLDLAAALGTTATDATGSYGLTHDFDDPAEATKFNSFKIDGTNPALAGIASLEIGFDGTDVTVKGYAADGSTVLLNDKTTPVTAPTNVGDKFKYSENGIEFEFELLDDPANAGTAMNFQTKKIDVSGLTAKLETKSTTPVNVDDSNTLKMQIGANTGQAMSIDVSDMRATALGISSTTSGATKVVKDSMGNDATASYIAIANVTKGTDNTATEYALDVTSATKSAAAIKVIDDSIASVSSERSKLGAFQNRLEHTINNLGAASENLTAAESRIRDVDMAKEMMEQTKNSILAQAAQAMLAQANQQPQGVLQLLR